MAITFKGTTGQEIVKLMRANKVTIRQLAARMNVTIKSVRAARTTGVSFLGSLDYWNGITGIRELPPRMRAMLTQYVAVKLS